MLLLLTMMLGTVQWKSVRLGGGDENKSHKRILRCGGTQFTNSEWVGVGEVEVVGKIVNFSIDGVPHVITTTTHYGDVVLEYHPGGENETIEFRYKCEFPDISYPLQNNGVFDFSTRKKFTSPPYTLPCNGVLTLDWWEAPSCTPDFPGCSQIQIGSHLYEVEGVADLPTMLPFGGTFKIRAEGETDGSGFNFEYSCDEKMEEGSVDGIPVHLTKRNLQHEVDITKDITCVNGGRPILKWDFFNFEHGYDYAVINGYTYTGKIDVGNLPESADSMRVVTDSTVTSEGFSLKYHCEKSSSIESSNRRHGSVQDGTNSNSPLGCYDISTGTTSLTPAFVLSYHTYVSRHETTTACIDLCRVRGMGYAAVALGTECLCGDAHPAVNLQAVETSDCDEVCWRQPWGCGPLRVMVHEVGG